MVPVVNSDPDSLRLYLEQIAKIPLLACEEALHSAQQVQRMVRLLELRQDLHKQLHRTPTLAQWAQWAQLSEKALHSALQDGQRAKRKLIEAHLRLVVVIARRYQNRGVDLLDLFQEGTIGLSRAVEKFDWHKGYKFPTYARWWIRREINRAVIAKEKDKSTLVQGESTKLLESLESEALLPEETVAQLQRVEFVRQLVDQLPARKRNVLVLLYGLIDRKPRSLSQTALELELTLEEVRWARDTGLEILRTGSIKAAHPKT